MILGLASNAAFLLLAFLAADLLWPTTARPEGDDQ